MSNQAGTSAGKISGQQKHGPWGKKTNVNERIEDSPCWCSDHGARGRSDCRRHCCAAPTKAKHASSSTGCSARRAAATPRELVIDQRGLGYLRRAHGALKLYGHGTSAEGRRREDTAGATGGDGSDDQAAADIQSDPRRRYDRRRQQIPAVVTDDVGVRREGFSAETHPATAPAPTLSRQRIPVATLECCVVGLYRWRVELAGKRRWTPPRR